MLLRRNYSDFLLAQWRNRDTLRPRAAQRQSGRRGRGGVVYYADAAQSRADGRPASNDLILNYLAFVTFKCLVEISHSSACLGRVFGSSGVLVFPEQEWFRLKTAPSYAVRIGYSPLIVYERCYFLWLCLLTEFCVVSPGSSWLLTWVSPNAGWHDSLCNRNAASAISVVLQRLCCCFCFCT